MFQQEQIRLIFLFLYSDNGTITMELQQLDLVMTVRILAGGSGQATDDDFNSSQLCFNGSNVAKNALL